MIIAPIHPDWDEMSALSASVEGWDLFPGFGGARKPYQMERRAELDVFASDEAAWRHVWKKSEAGSALHARALAFLKKHSPVEHADIRRHSLGLDVKANRFHPKQESVDT